MAQKENPKNDPVPISKPGRSKALPILPTHITPDHVRAAERGLKYLKRVQSSDGGFTGTADGGAYPIAMSALAGMAFVASGSTSSRGPYADQVKKVLRYLMRFQRKEGTISGPTQDNGRPMFGHGFALLFFATLYGMENDKDLRERLALKIKRAVALTARGQSRQGGWLYFPGGGDEGSVTITQLQALRACHNAGFIVPEKTIKKAIKYLERCRTPKGGIKYSLASGNDTRLPISAAAVACLYNAGAYDSKLAKDCLNYVYKKFKKNKSWSGGKLGGHAYYAHLYAAQAFYTAGDKYWRDYFPKYSRMLLGLQQKDGSWVGDGVGPVFGTACALVVLQLPYKFLPIYQR
ncbi:MAG: prenyltransferase/squalene oxidase repeat-containing protein [Planctomycetota bacterium]